MLETNKIRGLNCDGNDFNDVNDARPLVLPSSLPRLRCGMGSFGSFTSQFRC